MLMLLFTMFDEEIRIPGYFQGNSFEFTGEETQTEYSNVSSRSWYAPYLSLAYDLLMVEDEETWIIAREASDDDIAMMLDMYFLDENNEPIDTISTQYGDYTLMSDGTHFNIQKTAGSNVLLAAAPEESPMNKTTEPVLGDDDVQQSIDELIAELSVM